MREFLGQDKQMIVPRNKRHCNLVLFSFSCDSQDIFHTIQLRLRIQLDNKDLFLRRRSIKGDLLRYEFCDKPSDYVLKKITFEQTNVNYRELAKRILKSRFGLLFVYCDNSKMVHGTITHQLLDGYGIIKTFNLFLDNPCVPPNLVPKFTYYPALYELMIVKDLPKIIYNLPNRSLSHDYLWNETSHCEIIQHTGKFSYFKHLKEKASEKLGKRITVSVVVAATITNQLFRSTNKASLSIGIVGAFDNVDRCNNFASIFVTVKRSSCIYDIIDQIHMVVDATGRSQLIGSYLLSNIYGYSTNTNKLIDCLVSNIPMTQPSEVNKSPLFINRLEFIYPASPVYCAIWTNNGEWLISTTIRSKDVDHKAYSEPIEILDSSIKVD